MLASYSYTGESVNSLSGIESSSFAFPVMTQDSWSVVDVQAGLETDDWTLSVYIDNLFDEEAELFYNNRWAQQRLSANWPRTIGVNFRYNFNN
jgi:outer membrane receptor protein involved in Fe transport